MADEVTHDDEMTHDEKMMLALAALTYRGIVGNERGAQGPLRKALVPWLRALGPLGFGQWDPQWGPASFRVPLSLVDDAMVYVARRKDPPDRDRAHYVIAIRGTNPVSIFDWVFGDLWVDYQVAWSEAAPQALLSGSTALGDAIIRHLAAGDRDDDDGPFRNLAAHGRAVFGSLADRLQKLDARSLTSLQKMSDKDLLTHMETMMDRSTDGIRALALSRLGDLFGRVSEVLKPTRERFGDIVYESLTRKIVPPPSDGLRRSLLTFLNGIPDAEGARVSVTGHSKGGALVFATALWLEEDWAPRKKAEVDCFSFAGPTPGTSGFATHYNAALAERTHRVVNNLDIVPHAWNAADLRRIGQAYPELGALIGGLAELVGGLDYQHVHGRLCAFNGVRSTKRRLVARIIHHHLDAYLIKAGFKEPWRTVPIMTGSAAPVP